MFIWIAWKEGFVVVWLYVLPEAKSLLLSSHRPNTRPQLWIQYLERNINTPGLCGQSQGFRSDFPHNKTLPDDDFWQIGANFRVSPPTPTIAHHRFFFFTRQEYFCQIILQSSLSLLAMEPFVTERWPEVEAAFPSCQPSGWTLHSSFQVPCCHQCLPCPTPLSILGKHTQLLRKIKETN